MSRTVDPGAARMMTRTAWNDLVLEVHAANASKGKSRSRRQADPTKSRRALYQAMAFTGYLFLLLAAQVSGLVKVF